MTAAGWHPDPHGRADRRYHDGARWTEHVTDATGVTSTDPPDPDPDTPWPAAPVIGPPPPRATSSPTPTPSADHTQQLSPTDLGKAARPVAADHTVVMSPEDVAHAAAMADAPPPNPDATRHTMPIDPADVAAAKRLAEAGGSHEDTSELVVPTGRRRSRVGIVLAVLGTALGVAGLLLPWIDRSEAYLGFRELREEVDRAGPDLGAMATSFVLTGALLLVAGRGVTALARAIGTKALRVLAAALVVLGVAGLAVLGFAVTDVDPAAMGTPDAAVVGPAGGTPVTLPGGTPVTDPTSGAPVTVPEGGVAPSDQSGDQLVGAAETQAEDRLGDAAVTGAIVMVVAGALLVVGLLLRGPAGHVVTAVGLLTLGAWAVAATLALGEDELAGLGTGPWAVAASALVLAVAAVLPGRRDRAT